jgi:tRNA modification GTPase
MPVLRQKIVSQLIAGEPLRDAPAISNVRHLALVARARASTARAAALAESGASEEVLLVEIAEARHALEELTGQKTDDDLLRHVFERFCVGK